MFPCKLDGFFQTFYENNRAAFSRWKRVLARVARDDNVKTLGQGATVKRVESFSTHDHDVTLRGVLKKLHVFGDVPRQTTLSSNDTIFRARQDLGQDHTATGALIAGCGS
ncbi:hypothetical protein D3C86_1916870 [compost metagenome]